MTSPDSPPTAPVATDRPFEAFIPGLEPQDSQLMERMAQVVDGELAAGARPFMLTALDMATAGKAGRGSLNELAKKAAPDKTELLPSELPRPGSKYYDPNWLTEYNALLDQALAEKLARQQAIHVAGVAACHLAIDIADAKLARRIAEGIAYHDKDTALPTPEVLAAVTGSPGQTGSAMDMIRRERERRKQLMLHSPNDIREYQILLRHVVMVGAATYAAQVRRG